MLNRRTLPNSNLYGLAFTNHIRSMLSAIQDRFDATMCMSFLRPYAPTDWHRSVDFEMNRQVFRTVPTVLTQRCQSYWVAEYDSGGNLHYHGQAIFPSHSTIKRDPEYGDVLREALEPIQARIEAVARKYWSPKASFYIEPTYDYKKAIDYNLKALTPTADVIFSYIDLTQAEFLANQHWPFGSWYHDFKRTGRGTMTASAPVSVIGSNQPSQLHHALRH